MILDEGMHPVDEAQIWLPAVPEIGNETRIIQGGCAERRSGHAAAGQESFDISKELFGMGHDGAIYRTIPLLQEGNSYFPQNRKLPTSVAMDAVRKLILEKTEERGTNLAELSRRIGRNHAYLQQFINRGIPIELGEKVRPLLAHALGIAETDLKSGLGAGGVNQSKELPQRRIARPDGKVTMSTTERSNPAIMPGSSLFGEADFPVFGTAQGGRGALIVTGEPVDWVVRPAPLLRVREGYGMLVTGDSMSPAHKSGSTALVNPHLPWRGGDICVFRNHADDGAVTACIKELVRFTDELWYVKQYNPKKTFTLKRSEWQICHVAVGNYAPR